MLAKDGDGPADFENGNKDGWPAEWDKKNQVRRLEQEKNTTNKELTMQWEK